jgi:N-acetylglucosamine-6-sulfatase
VSEVRAQAKAVSIILLLVLASSSEAPLHTERVGRESQAPPPSFVLILADDLDWAALRASPSLARRLGERGVTFSDAFVADARCCPSRVSVLTGQYVHNHGVLHNAPPRGGFATFHADGGETSTVAVWLQAAGYRTALVGKYLNGYPGPTVPSAYVPPGWDDWHAVTGQLAYFNYTTNDNGVLSHHGANESDYLTDVLGTTAVGAIAAAQAQNQPLFLYLAPYAPHQPALPAPRDAQAKVAHSTEGSSFNEADVSDKPQWVQAFPSLDARQARSIAVLDRRRLRSLLGLEKMLDRVLRALDEAHMRDNTYVIFTSDNGFHAGQHRLPRGKGTAYEEDVHVPLFISGPGIEGGSSRDQLVSLIDLAPTIAQLAHISAPDNVDGRSLLQILGGSGQGPWRTALLVEDGGSAGPNQIRMPAYAAVRTERYLYVEYRTGERELYDLREDPWELENIAPLAKRSLVETLHAALLRLQSCSAATCRMAEESFVLSGG